MRKLLAVLVLTIGAAARPAAQDGQVQKMAGPEAAVEPAQAGLVEEPLFITKTINWLDRQVDEAGGPKDGFYAEFGNMITGSGWISAGPGYRHHLLRDRALFTASSAISWNVYKMAQARFELPRLAKDRVSVGSQVIYQDMLKVNYFGLGNDSAEADRGGYRLDETDVFGYAAVRPTGWLSVNGRFGWIHQAELSTMTGWSVTYPNTTELFTDATAPGLNQQPAFLHGDVSIAADTRNYASHPTSGGLYRATVTAYSDRDYGKYSFRRYELEAAQFVPIVPDKWVFAVRGFAVFSDTSGGNTVPFYLLPSLGA